MLELGKSVLVSMAVLAVALAVQSCRDRSEAPVSRENMENILYDMFTLDEFLYSRGDIRAQSDSTYAYLPILEKYGCSIEDFHSSIDYYLRHIDDFIKLSSSVKDRLATELAMLDSASVRTQAEKEEIADTLTTVNDSPQKIPKGEKKRRKLDKEKMKEFEEKFK